MQNPPKICHKICSSGFEALCPPISDGEIMYFVCCGSFDNRHFTEATLAFLAEITKLNRSHRRQKYMHKE